MSLFMDVYTFGPGVSFAHLVAACEEQLTAKRRFGFYLLRFWVSEPAGKMVCLVAADDPDLIPYQRNEASSLAAHEIYPVSEHIRFRPAPGSSNRGTPLRKGD